MDRDAIIGAIEHAYGLRTAGESVRLGDTFAPGATFELAGHSAGVAGMPATPAPAMEAIRWLMATFTFHSITRKHSVVEGDRAAVLWDVELSGPSGERVTTQLYDLWTFEGGKAKSLFQYGDTALLARLVVGQPSR